MMISIILKDLDFLLNFNFLQKKTFLLKKGVIKKLVGAVEVKICQAKKVLVNSCMITIIMIYSLLQILKNNIFPAKNLFYD